MLFGNKSPLRDERHKAKLTQHQLAKLIDRSQAYIYKVEAGYLNPPIEVWEALARALRCKVDDIKPKESADV